VSYLEFIDARGSARLHGAEHAMLRSIARGPAELAWGLTEPHGGEHRLHALLPVLELMRDDGHSGGYVHQFGERTRALLVTYDRWHEANRRLNGGGPLNSYVPFAAAEQERALLVQLGTHLNVGGAVFEVAGHRLQHDNLALNTALAMGSDPVRLATKLTGWDHVYVEGPNREWLARVVEVGREAGCFRAGMGWQQVVAFLRERDDSPVYTWHSVNGNPTYDLADWEPAELSADWVPAYTTVENWRSMTDDEREEYRQQDAPEQFDELPEDERHRLVLAGLRKHRPWAELCPEKLGEVYFGVPLTVYALLAPDREERVRRAHGDELVPA
jgi:hypothetical protein